MADKKAKKLTAKERKERAAAKSRTATKKANGRRAGRVTKYVSQAAKTAKPGDRSRAINKAFIPVMGKPQGLSPQAAFEDLRPDCVSPLDWFRLFTPDESVWEALVEEAAEAVQDGELDEYPEDAPANVSRRKLRELRGDVA